MDLLQLIMRIALPVLYGASACLYVAQFVKREGAAAGTATGQTPRGKSADMVLASALVLHILFLGARTFSTGHLPLSNTPEALSTCVAMIAVVYVCLEWSMHERSLGAFIVPVITVLQIVSSVLLPEGRELPDVLKSRWLEIHVSLTLMAYTAFAIACVSSLMYVFLYDEVRAKHLGFFHNRLPPLRTLDGLNHRAATLGFVFLTLGMVSGALWSAQAWGRFWRWDPKLTAAFITWLVYAVHLYVRTVSGWSGKRASYFSVAGFVIALVTFAIVGILQPGGQVHP